MFLNYVDVFELKRVNKTIGKSSFQLYRKHIFTMSTWKRPESVPFPTIWAKFEGKIVRNGVRNTYWIQEVTDEYKSQVLQYMMEEFTLDEPFCKYSKISEDPDVMKQFKDFWWESFKENLALVCLTKDQNGVTHIAGMNCTLLGYKGEDDIIKNKLDEKGLSVFYTLKFVKNQVDPFQKFNITEYLDGMGLYVLPKYRGEGLGTELLRARYVSISYFREPMCRALGLKATLTLFTSKISQILAERLGFKDLYVADYADLEKNPGLMTFPGIQEHTKSIRFMYLLYK
ncbi:n-acetyltransferase-related [Holotrichia oblita]|uniref:N-acetyltransferase-related n=1 Tax=Holotrichia oblita TaxID=644536 RepID=A0ACB9TEJ2_HOLOL|nr:n-acetyltransferase-related [Holotrichia oblita]